MVAVIEDRRQPRAERKRDDTCAVRGSESITHDVKCIGLSVRLSLERFKSGRDVLRSLDFEWQGFEAEGASGSPNLAHCDTRSQWCDPRSTRVHAVFRQKQPSTDSRP